jgi:hypothetical protein
MTETQHSLLIQVEIGFAHSLPSDMLGQEDRAAFDSLVALGWLRHLPAKEQPLLPARYVTTSAGSYALGTFDHMDLP